MGNNVVIELTYVDRDCTFYDIIHLALHGNRGIGAYFRQCKVLIRTQELEIRNFLLQLLYVAKTACLKVVRSQKGATCRHRRLRVD